MELMSNGYPIVNSPAQLGQLISSDPHAPIADLRAQLKVQGYLWLRGFFPREDVSALRQRFFERMRPTGILAEGKDAAEGIFSGQRDQTGQTTKLLMEFVRG
ncbi:MAG: hypothetical protein KA765_03805 [Thermoflexales bacterium]|nr:hypothetical protein [Thermoflexales bacterium]